MHRVAITLCCILQLSLATRSRSHQHHIAASRTTQETEPLLEEYRVPQCRLPNSTEWWLARLKVITELSSHPLPSTNGITLVSHVTLNRLNQLDALCATWDGPISAAVHVPTFKGMPYNTPPGMDTVESILQQLMQLHERLTGASCTLNLVVAEEILPEEHADMIDSFWMGYPNNALRNVALDAAGTDLVLLLDADFVPGPVGAYERLMKNYGELVAVAKQQALIVLPAFRSFDRYMNNGTAQERDAWYQWLINVPDKEALIQGWDNQTVEVFSRFHNDTDYVKWRVTKHMYKTQYGTTDPPDFLPGWYEPYFIAARELLPKWDERFRGYHFNKMMYCWLLSRIGFVYHIHPEVFVTHLPHAKGLEAGETLNNAKSNTLRYIFNVEMRRDVSLGVYNPVACPTHMAHERQTCVASDSSLKEN